MAWRLLGIGWYIPLCILAGAFIGYKLDQKFDTDIVLTLIGATVGLLIAFLGVYHIVHPLLNEEKDKHKESN